MKKLSQKNLNDFNILSKAKIGFEFEFYSNLSFYKTLEIFNLELSPAKLYGHKVYHPDTEYSGLDFMLTPDLSGGSNMAELITTPLNYFDAKFYLIKILSLIKKYGYTNEKSGIHINISFDDIPLTKLNVLKLILNIDEDKIYSKFPNRQNNIYAKSVKTIIPYKEYDFANLAKDMLQNAMKLPNDKYYGINFLHINSTSPRLEFRYLGGEGYEKKVEVITEFLDYFILETRKCLNAQLSDIESDKLYDYLEENISNFKNFESYDKFIVEYPHIDIQIDGMTIYDTVTSYYPKIYKKIFDFVTNVEDLKEGIINYYTENQKIEIVNAKFKTIFNLKEFDFIDCEINSGIFDNCLFHNTTINEAHINKSVLVNSEATKCKLLSCNVDRSELNDCFFMEGYLNGEMNGGIFRSGKMGVYAYLSSTTKVVNTVDNFFGIDYGDNGIDKKVKDKGKM